MLLVLFALFLFASLNFDQIFDKTLGRYSILWKNWSDEFKSMFREKNLHSHLLQFPEKNKTNKTTTEEKQMDLFNIYLN